MTRTSDLPARILNPRALGMAQAALDAFLDVVIVGPDGTLEVDMTVTLPARALEYGTNIETESARVVSLMGNAATEGVALFLHICALTPRLEDFPPMNVAESVLRWSGNAMPLFRWTEDGELMPGVDYDLDIIRLIDKASPHERQRIGGIYPLHLQLYLIANDPAGPGIPYLEFLAAGHDPDHWEG